MTGHGFHKKNVAMLIGIGLYGMIINAVPVLANTEVEKYTNTDFAMNTVVSETLYTTGKNLNPSVGELLKNTEENLLSWRRFGRLRQSICPGQMKIPRLQN